MTSHNLGPPEGGNHRTGNTLVTIVTQRTKCPNLFASFLHLIVIQILKYWSNFRHIKNLLWKSLFVRPFIFALSCFFFFLMFYFPLIFLRWLKEFGSCKELWLTFILMISFPSYGLVREARAQEGPMLVINKAGHCGSSAFPANGLYRFINIFLLSILPFPFLSVCAWGPLTHPKLLLFFILLLWLVYFHNLLPPTSLLEAH